jgi:hypothetical protein
LGHPIVVEDALVELSAACVDGVVLLVVVGDHVSILILIVIGSGSFV